MKTQDVLYVEAIRLIEKAVNDLKPLSSKTIEVHESVQKLEEGVESLLKTLEVPYDRKY